MSDWQSNFNLWFHEGRTGKEVKEFMEVELSTLRAEVEALRKLVAETAEIRDELQTENAKLREIVEAAKKALEEFGDDFQYQAMRDLRAALKETESK